MKKLFLTLLGLTLVNATFATGVIQNNAFQTGSSTFTASSGLLVTNTFPVPYTIAPIVQVSSSVTNNTPFSVSAVTLTNFVLTVTTAATTNVSVNWAAYPGYPRILTGTNSITAGTFVTNTFNPSFAYIPIMNFTGFATNGGASIISLTPSNFIESAAVTQGVQWGAFGIAYQPGLSTVTY